MNPFMMGPLAMTAWSNPDLFSSAMAAQGVSPDMIGGATGANAVANPLVPQGMDQMDPLAAMMTPSMEGGMASPMMLGGPTPGSVPMGPGALSGLGQAVAPKAAEPIMSAGVSGSQKAPELTVGAGGKNHMQQLVMQMLLRQGQQGAPSVPGLPSLVRGI